MEKNPMDWVKTAIYATVLWIGAAMLVAVGFLWYTNTHSRGREADRAFLAKAGEYTGYVTGTGIGITWLGLFAQSNLSFHRPKRKKKRRRSGQAPRGNL
jgi:hypothetical protein